MTNGKSLGASPNARPNKSLNQRPAGLQPREVQRQMPSSGQAVLPKKPLGSSSQPVAQTASVANLSATANVSSQVTSTNKDVVDFVNVLRNMVGSFAILNEDTINKNLRLAAGKGMSNEDRTVSFECAEYLISNLAYIFMGLVLDKNFKTAFLDSLMIELQFDSKPDDVKKKTREEMKDKTQYKSSGSIVIGVTSFMPAVETELMNKMQAGFTALDAYADEFDAETAKLTNEQKVEFGFIFSNFMYLIRAFTHNDMFMSYVITVIEKVKSMTSK
ncbi:hypothetical protein J6A31_02595 [bacterium]|nr:hypothetical protein [bacterium]